MISNNRMVYFLGVDKMEEIKESCLDDIKCVEQYCMTEADFNSLWNHKISVYNHALLCQEEEEDLVKKIFYCGKLPQFTHTDIEFAGNTIVLDSIYESHISWKKRIKLKIIEDKATLLSIHSDDTKQQNMQFVNGEFDMEYGILFNHKFTEIVAAEFNESFLAIVTGNLELKHKDDCWIFQVEKRPHYFILIKVIPKNESKSILTEVFRVNLDECFPNLEVVKIQFNINLSSKLLLIAQNEIFDFLITFNLRTLQFSSSLNLKECLNYSRHEVFYFYDHILKDIIIFMDNINHVVYIVKKSLQNVLYIYKKNKLELPGSYNIIYNTYCCNNRNNEIILFFTAQIEEEVTEKLPIFVYDVFKDQIHGKVCDINRDESSPMFFNSTGEEILIAEKNESNDYVLNVFVYKSKLRSLKTMCQMVVLQQYSTKQLHKMSLPKNIFKTD